MSLSLIWYSTAPWVGVGYGVLTKELVKRMIADGHNVRVATKHHLGGQLVIEGIECFDGQEVNLVNMIAEQEDVDYIISYNDAWVFSKAEEYFIRDKWVACLMLDAEFIHPKMVEAMKRAKYQVASTFHGKNELERVGFKPYYAPLGVDTDLFRPDDEARKIFRERMGWDEKTFVIGNVGINYPTDRKNLIGLIKAFQKFHQIHPDSALYLHTDVMGSSTSGLPLKWIIQSAGFKDDNKGAVRWVDQKSYHLWNISQKYMIQLYNAADIMCYATQGEGFNLPLVEAQSCGCPVITTDTTSGKELMKGGWLIPVTDDDYEFSSLLTWVARVRPTVIEEELEKAYDCWKRKEDYEAVSLKAREGVLEYDWDKVYEKYWRPLLAFLEKEKEKEIVHNLPDYERIYKEIDGTLLYLSHDCKDILGCKTCYAPKIRLQGESTEQFNPILARSYPLLPNAEFELLVDTRCPLHSLLCPRFKKQIKELWRGLFTFPKVREEIKQLNRVIDMSNFTSLEGIEIDAFGETYKKAYQMEYYTTFKIDDKILKHVKGNKLLDVGCGNGKRIKELRQKNFDAIGVELNPYWVDNEIIFQGDVKNLQFEDDTFDAVLTVDVLEHLENPKKAIQEMLRVSKDKVIVCITPLGDETLFEDPTHRIFWPIEQWKRELSEYGKIVDWVPGTGIFVMEKRK